ncbi:MAG: GDP-mannose 4,6-dehydratase [Candidatus Diapherotrites archaeon]|nr:GDP-mannose 4,6-dehydratase [Candidatus Micrarchaeota archaeon]MBU1940114.1 GDP-mannose 4,6-dehydratase [Candidatus Micrarchaeota archaeon]
MADYKLEGMQGKNVLVLGGLGFIGSNTMHKCVELGASVTAFDAMLGQYGANMANLEGVKEKVEFVKADMRDFDALAEAVKGKDYIFNCAGQVSHVDSMENPLFDVELNVQANLNLLETCRKHNDSVKIVYAGTIGQFGSQEYLPIDEKHPTMPKDVYGIDKLAAEKYHLLYSENYGMNACSLRINNTYGERHQMKHGNYGILNWFIRLALENKKITVFGEGTQLRDYCYVQDIVDAQILAAQSEKANGKFYCTGTGKGMKFVDMVKMIIEKAGSGESEMVPFPAKRQRIEVGDVYFSHKKIKEELGWEPKTEFAEGLGKTIEFYRANLQKYI